MQESRPLHALAPLIPGASPGITGDTGDPAGGYKQVRPDYH